MGIRCLNRYLTKNCKKTSIQKSHLSSLRDKFIVIDISIYLYKFASQNALHEKVYHMISLFHKYNIIPLFVFDGKPPPEKNQTLKERRLNKIDAESKYNNLDNELSTTEDSETKAKIIREMEQLKRQFVKISEKDVSSVKEIMDTFGVRYYSAYGEADQFCASIQKSSKYDCYACMSDDMDMFVYGCSRVIRNFNLTNETLLVYNMDNILQDLNISSSIFKQIAVLSGTDYNPGDNNVTLYETLRWYNEFNKKNTNINISNDNAFYNWLQQNTKYIANMESLMNIHKMFDLIYIEEDLNIDVNKNYDSQCLKDVMTKHGFVFV
jgi:flap endonuclease-1